VLVIERWGGGERRQYTGISVWRRGADHWGVGAALLALGAPFHSADAGDEMNLHLAAAVGEASGRSARSVLWRIWR